MVMIHKTDYGVYVASSNDWYIPGVYDSKRAATYAFRFSDSDLLKLQDEKNKTTKVITFEDLQKLRKQI